MFEFFLSGGALNTNPAQSLGGAISASNIPTQTANYYSTVIPGVTILGSFGNAVDSSGSDFSAAISVKTVASQKYLYFSRLGSDPFYEVAGGNNFSAITADGPLDLSWTDYELLCSLRLQITAASVPSGPQTARISVQPTSANTLFGDLNKSQVSAAQFSYRCFYIKNVSGAATPIRVYVSKQSASCYLALGLDPAGVDGAAVTIASESIAPAGVVFGAAYTPSAGLQANLPAGSFVPIWFRRQPVALLGSPVFADETSIAVET